MNNRGIGVFDSGLGGLTVAKEIMKLLPKEQIIYLGDTARTPYGTKTKETIIRFSEENTRFLLKHKVKAIVVACNTASALALAELKSVFSVPMTGVIDAGARAAADATRNGRIGVIGTRATVGSGSYRKALAAFNRNFKVFQKATPLLVPLVEEGWLRRKETEAILRAYLKDFRAKKIDTLVLGCTHYPLLKPLMKKILPDVRIIDSATVTAATVLGMVKNEGLSAGKNNRKKTAFYVTDAPDSFNKIGSMFMGKDMVKARKVNL